MRFALTACKFEERHLCHQFFNDLLSLFGAISPNVAKKGDKKNGENGQEGHHPKIPQKVLQNTSQPNCGCNSVKWASHKALMALRLICIHFHINK